VVHSATKYLGGHGTSLGGVIVDLGTFDFAAEPARWPQLTESYRRVPGGSLVERFGATGSPFIALVKTKYVHDLGPSLSAFNAFQLLQGLETLDLRMARHSASGQQVAQFLEGHAAVSRVNHPGLASSPWHDLAREYLPRGAASVFSFDVQATGDPEADFALIEALIGRLQVIRLVANIGDARSLIAHPASMTHSHLSAEQLAEAGIMPTTIRLSIGLEDPADLIADLERALAPLAVGADAAADQSLSSAAWP
jgi:O-acetylhomoserine (thiol)-lyase